MLLELLYKSRQLCDAGQVNLNRCGANAKSNQVFYSLRRSVFLFALGDDNVSAFGGQADGATRPMLRLPLVMKTTLP